MKGIDRLHKTDGADGDQVFEVYVGVFKLLCDVNDKAQIPFHQNAAQGRVLRQTAADVHFFFGGQRRGQGVGAVDIIYFLLRAEKPQDRTHEIGQISHSFLCFGALCKRLDGGDVDS